MTYFIIGSRGRLGQAISRTLIGKKVVLPDRAVYEEWSRPNSSNKISKYFESAEESDVILVASGLTDPQIPSDELMSINYSLPKNIVESTAKKGLRVITFGTILEDLIKKNAYIESKFKLGEYIRSLHKVDSNAVHVRLHTLYGLGQPTPSMFLGKIFFSLKHNIQFQMTSGRQLREYHHFLDDAESIKRIANSRIVGVTNISHGKPVRLKELAMEIFSSFNSNHLLKLGALPDPPEENYCKKFQKSRIEFEGYHRDSITAIVDYLRTCLSDKA